MTEKIDYTKIEGEQMDLEKLLPTLRKAREGGLDIELLELGVRVEFKNPLGFKDNIHVYNFVRWEDHNGFYEALDETVTNLKICKEVLSRADSN